MADKNVQAPGVDESAVVIEKAKGLWETYQKPVTYIGGGLLVIIAGWFVYNNFFKAPKEEKANDAIARAQQFFATDSVKLALNGDAATKGFLKIAKEYSGTAAGNLANYYAGVCYLKMDDYKNAEKFLKEFSTDDKFIQARAYGLLGDALSEQKKYSDAVEYYKKAAAQNEKDENFNAEYLFRAGLLYASQLNKTADAIAVYKQIRDDYPKTQRGFEIEKYLAELGETK